MKQYLNYLESVMYNGILKEDRTGIGTVSTFAQQMRFDLQKGFPLITTKKMHLRSVIYELLWFLKGDTNIQYLIDNDVTIWNNWADDAGALGPIYGKQWRAWESSDGRVIDQMHTLIEDIKTNPHSRRLIVSAWNVGELRKMALAPCHLLFQFYVANGQLSCHLTQRSADSFLGVPFNIASYALLTHMIAQQCDLDVGELIWSGGDCHIYLSHLTQVKLQLSREPFPLPELIIEQKPRSLFDYSFEDFTIENYKYHARIKAPIAI